MPLHLGLCVEQLTNWPITVSTTNATADTFVRFFKDHILRRFGSPNTLVSENAFCFKSKVVEDFMKSHGIIWKIVIGYTPI